MSINNDNIVKIGVALKWRNTFDLTKKYYQENVVTACGCVFRCKVLQAQGKSPIMMTDDQGHIVYANTDVWDVLVDMAYYYNNAVDTRELTQQTLDYVKTLDEATQRQQKEIEALQEDTRVLSEAHRQDIKDLTDKHDAEISALTANIVRQNKIQDNINAHLQDQVNDLNTITDVLAEDINGLDERLSNDLEAIRQRMSDTEDDIATITSNVEANSSAIQTNTSAIANIAAEIKTINQRVEEYQSEYEKMLEDIRTRNGCFENGEWSNPFFWNNTDVWCNTPNSISETSNEIISHDNRLTALESQFALFIQQFAVQQTIIEQHQSQLETLMDCFTVLNVGKYQNLLLWDNASKWSNILITEANTSVGNGGDSTVTVKSYDPDTATVTI